MNDLIAWKAITLFTWKIDVGGVHRTLGCGAKEIEGKIKTKQKKGRKKLARL